MLHHTIQFIQLDIVDKKNLNSIHVIQVAKTYFKLLAFCQQNNQSLTQKRLNWKKKSDKVVAKNFQTEQTEFSPQTRKNYYSILCLYWQKILHFNAQPCTLELSKPSSISLPLNNNHINPPPPWKLKLHKLLCESPRQI